MQTPDVGAVLRKSFELMGNRPIPLIGSAAVAQLPALVATLAVLPFAAPFVERMQRGILNDSNDPEAILRLFVDQMPLFVGLGLGVGVLMFAVYAVQLGATMSVVFDAYREIPSKVGSALRAGLGRAPSLFVYLLVKYFAAVGAVFTTLVVVLLPLVAMSSDAAGRDVASIFLVIAGSFGGALLGLLVWAMLSLGAGAIVAEKLGPFAGLARGFHLARRAPWTVLLVWLATVSLYLLSACLVGCGSGIVTGIVQVGAGQTVSSIVGQLVQFVPMVALAALQHTVGAVLFGELAGVGASDAAARTVDVFR